MSRRRLPFILLIVSMLFSTFGLGTPAFAQEHQQQIAQSTASNPAPQAASINPDRVSYLWSVSHTTREFIQYMDGIYDREGGYLSGATSQGETIIVPAPAVAWSGSLWMKPGAVPLWVDSDFVGVYYVESPVDMQGGRYFRLTRQMDPCNELIDWGTCDGVPKWVPGGNTSPQATAQPVAQPGATAATSDVPQLQAVMPVSDFAAMWTSTPGDNPKPLIDALDRYFDFHKENLVGGQAATNLEVPVNSVVWTDLQGTVHLQDGSQAGPGKLVPLRTIGTYGVYYAYDNVTLSVGGRYARTDRALNPERDLSGWRR